MTEAARSRTGYTIAEYLAYERTAEGKHEYHDGQIVAMAGGSPKHALVMANFAGELRQMLKGKTCRVYGSDLKIHAPANRSIVYPDVSVVCGEPVSHPDAPGGESIINPTLVVEVLSPSTEAYDRKRKFGYYMALESFREYVLVSSEEPRIETFLRQPDGAWLFRFVEGLEQSITLRSLDVTLSLAEVYAGVTFEPPEPAEKPALQI